MKVVDLNVLVYVVNAGSPLHGRAMSWREAVLAGDEPIGLA